MHSSLAPYPATHYQLLLVTCKTLLILHSCFLGGFWGVLGGADNVLGWPSSYLQHWHVYVLLSKRVFSNEECPFLHIFRLEHMVSKSTWSPAGEVRMLSRRATAGLDGLLRVSSVCFLSILNVSPKYLHIYIYIYIYILYIYIYTYIYTYIYRYIYI